METNRLHWKIGGAAGQGVKSSGIIFAKTCTRGGLYAFGYTEYPSLIKGGHNTYQVRVEEEPTGCIIKKINMLIALNKETIILHKEELATGAAIIYDPDKTTINEEEYGRPDIKFIKVPAHKLLTEEKLSPIMENQVFLGASIALLEYDFEILASVIRDEFKDKGEKIEKEDVLAARKGYEYVKQNYNTTEYEHKLKPTGKQKKVFITGNEAIALGAIQGGLTFYSAYPMTPASSILHTLAKEQQKYRIVVKQTEDEISAINMAIGAATAGARAMTGTSGGGFALMNEGYSLAAMTETPLVIVEAMRGGPATGIPTWTEQSDLKFILNAGHGDFPRFVLAPGTPAEAYEMTQEALNIAEKYQTPVIIISDKHLSESHWAHDPEEFKKIPIIRDERATNEELKELASKGIRFKRYSLETETGVSKRTIPGQHKNGIYLANSDEHDEYGYSTEDPEIRNKMMEKRLRKIEAYKKEMPPIPEYGEEEYELLLICWGSTKEATIQATKWLNNEGIKTKTIHINRISPFPKEQVKEKINKAKKTLNIEQNATAQMAQVIREQTGIEIKEHLLRYDGRPIMPEDILEKAKEIMRG